MTFPSSIQTAIGAPGNMRIGQITAIEDGVALVMLENTVLDPDAVGFLNTYVPAVGDVVAVSGQSAQPSARSASWLVHGKIVGAPSTLPVLSLIYSDQIRAAAVFDFDLAPVVPMTLSTTLPAGTYVSVATACIDASVAIDNTTNALGDLLINGVVQPGQMVMIQIGLFSRGDYSMRWRTVHTLATDTTLTFDYRAMRGFGADNSVQGFENSSLDVMIWKQ